MNWFRRLSFRKKILTSYILFIGLSFLLSGVYCIKSIRTSRQESMRYMHQFAEQVNLNMDVIFSNMDRVRFLHLIDDTVKPMIRTQRDKKTLAKALEDDDYVTRALNHMTNMNQYVLRATIVNEYGDVYSNIKTENSAYLDRMFNIQCMQDWEDRHKIYYTGVYRETINMVEYPLITSISKLYDIDQESPIGTLYIDLNFSAVRQILNHTLEPANTGTRLMIFDHKGNLIYHTGQNEEVWGDIRDGERKQITGIIKSEGSDGNQELQINGKESVISIMDSETTGWRMLVYTPLSDIYAAGLKNIAGLAIMMAIVLIMAMVLGIILSGQISQPVSILIKAMEKVDRGTVKCIDEKEYNWQDEMGLLLHSYNQMGRRINESIEKIYVYQLNQKQTELRMLQFQINPHFLYNTLNTISSIALLEGVDEIAKISDNLSNMFQYNIKGSDIVPFDQEFKQANRYMTIQTIRFPGKFEFTQHIPQAMYDEPVLKFVLQPLVENSLKHAFPNMRELNRIELEAFFDEQDIEIRIRDNGIGMDGETVRKLNEELEEMNTKTLVANVDRGIGLRNVNARIRNFYGKGYGIKIQSREGEYTVIQIRMRRISGGGQEEEKKDAQNCRCG